MYILLSKSWQQVILFFVVDSLYFQHDEIEELKHIANYDGDWEEESVRGVVAERVKVFEKSANSDEEKYPDNSLSEEMGEAREDDNNEGHVVEVWQQAVTSSSSNAGGSTGEKVWSTDEQTIVQIASQNVRQIWDERTKGIRRCMWVLYYSI